MDAAFTNDAISWLPEKGEFPHNLFLKQKPVREVFL